MTTTKENAESKPLALRASLRDLKLLRCDAVNSEKRPAELKQDVTIHFGRHNEEPVMFFIYEFAIIGGEDTEPQFRIAANFGVAYEVEGGIQGVDEDHGLAFAQTTGILVAWPYWREFVQSVTSRMGLPSLRLPLIRPAEIHFSEDDPAKTDRKRLPKKSKRAKKN